MQKHKNNSTCTRDELVEEATRRLNIIDPSLRMAAQYKDDGIQVSALCFRSCDETDAMYDPVINKFISDMFKNTRAVPYHIIRSWVDNNKGDYDVVDYVLLVFDNKPLWEMEREMLMMGIAPTALMYNHSNKNSDLVDVAFDVSEDGVLGILGWNSLGIFGDNSCSDKIEVFPL